MLNLTKEKEKKTSCVQRRSWKVSGLKGCFKCAAWFAPWLCIHSSSWSVFAALQKGTFTENQWHRISAELVPSAGEQSNLWQLHTIPQPPLPQVREEGGRCLPTRFPLRWVSALPGKPNTVTDRPLITVKGTPCTEIQSLPLLSWPTRSYVLTELKRKKNERKEKRIPISKTYLPWFFI